jgi:hypothetical protein
MDIDTSVRADEQAILGLPPIRTSISQVDKLSTEGDHELETSTPESVQTRTAGATTSIVELEDAHIRIVAAKIFKKMKNMYPAPHMERMSEEHVCSLISRVTVSISTSTPVNLESPLAPGGQSAVDSRQSTPLTAKAMRIYLRNPCGDMAASPAVTTYLAAANLLYEHVVLPEIAATGGASPTSTAQLNNKRGAPDSDAVSNKAEVPQNSPKRKKVERRVERFLGKALDERIIECIAPKLYERISKALVDFGTVLATKLAQDVNQSINLQYLDVVKRDTAVLVRDSLVQELMPVIQMVSHSVNHNSRHHDSA